MEAIQIVTMDEVLQIHDGWIDQWGGSPSVWSPDVLMYAYEAQLSPYYETIYQKAANFAGRITKEHAFVDGNTLLPTFDEAYEVFRRLALGTDVPGEMTYGELAEWLQENSIAAVA